MKRGRSIGRGMHLSSSSLKSSHEAPSSFLASTLLSITVNVGYTMRTSFISIFFAPLAVLLIYAAHSTANQGSFNPSLFTIPREDPLPLSALESQLASDHARYQQVQHLNRLRLPKDPSIYDHQRSLMQSFFFDLPHSPPSDLPLHLSNINELRVAGYRFPSHIDPGLHQPFGTPWDFTRFGPYPSTRLAQRPFDEAAGEAKAHKVKVEIENAQRALDKQSLLEVNGKGYAGLMAFTDDVELLRSAVEYHARRMQEEVNRAGRGMIKVARTRI